MNVEKKADNNGKSDGPLFGEAQLRNLFQCLAGYPAIALAVSGGADSTALMFLVRRWLDFFPAGNAPHATILTVDHGLRAEAAQEAQWVAEKAAQCGFSHHTLVWKGAKPKTGFQEAARAARYTLMTEFCRQRSIPAIATAHLSDDQAETVIMRLARGSGVDGLSGMAPVSEWNGIDIVRPLLCVRRAELTDFLRSDGRDWLEDPSNRNVRFERVRIRKALDSFEKLGVSRGKLALSARRLRRARDALESATADFLTANLSAQETGFGDLSFAAFLDAPEEIALRAIIRMVRAFGDAATQTQLSKIEDAYRKLQDRPRTLTLGGCQIALRHDRILIAREYGRMDASELSLAPGDSILWDGRFSVSVGRAALKHLKLRPLGPVGIKALKELGGALKPAPRAANLALPSLWQGSQLCYAPFVNFEAGSPKDWIIDARAAFVNFPLLFAHRAEKRSNTAK